jgi:hypothetical protein
MKEKNSGTGEQELPAEDQIAPVIIDEGKQSPKKTTPKKKGFQTLMQKVGLSLLFLLIGMLIATLVLYLPAASKLKDMQSELSSAQSEVERLTTVEAAYAQLQDQHAQVTSELGVYKTISDLGLLESALLSGDTTRVSQQLRYVEDDLNRMQMTGFADIQQRLVSQFRKVKTSAASDAQTALKEVLVLREDLRLFAEKFE